MAILPHFLIGTTHALCLISMRKSLYTVAAMAVLAGGVFTTGCEVHHEESDHPNFFGGHTETDKTTVDTPGGDVHVDTKTTHTD
jgi:hypothetical protein